MNNSVSNFFEVSGELIVNIIKSTNIIAEGNKILISNLKAYFVTNAIVIRGKIK
jgi:hypothetical protein